MSLARSLMLGWPQWSPPVIGGSTERPERVAPQAAGPQWSPPVIGGSTPGPFAGPDPG